MVAIVFLHFSSYKWVKGDGSITLIHALLATNVLVHPIMLSSSAPPYCLIVLCPSLSIFPAHHIYMYMYMYMYVCMFLYHMYREKYLRDRGTIPQQFKMR